MSTTKQKIVPLSDRTFIIGDGELMGYLGVSSVETLNKKFFDKGLKPTSQIGKTKYYAKREVDAFILKMNEYQEVTIGYRRK